jgi:hypothetical protein
MDILLNETKKLRESKNNTNAKHEKQSHDSDKIIFIPYDDPPQPIGGFAAIQKNLYYP